MSDVRSLVWSIETIGGDRVKHAIESINSSFDEVSKKMTKMGGKLTKGVTLPFVGAATAGVKMFMDVDTGIHKVMTLADKTVLPFDKLKTSITDMSNATGVAQTELLDATYEALSSGVESEKVLGFVNSAVDLTRAGFTDMTTAIDATTTVLNAYGDKAFGVEKIHDIFVQTQDKGKISVDELGKSIGRVIPTASSLGVNLDQLGASYAILTAEGQNSQLATTNLNAMLGELGTTGSKVDKALRGTTGKSFAELTEAGYNIGEVLETVNDAAKDSGLTLSDMFGSRMAGMGAQTLLGVAGSADKFTESLNNMNNATGKTKENAEEMETDAMKIQRAVAQVKNAMIEVGGIVAPIVTKVAGFISKLVTKFNDLPEATKKQIVAFAGVAAAIGPLLSIGSKLIGSISSIGSAISFLTSPIGLIIAAITAFIAIFVHLYQTNDEFRDKVKSAWESIKNIVEWVSVFWNNSMGGMREIFGIFVSFFVDRVANLVSIFTHIVGIISAIIDGDWSAVWEHAKGLLLDFLEFMLTIPAKMCEIGKSIVVGFGEGLKGLGKGLWDNTLGKIPGLPTFEGKDGSHRTGKANVPYDGYRAELHKGEEVLTVSDPRNSRNLRKGEGYGQGGIVYSPNISINVSGTAEDTRKFKKAVREIFEQDIAKFFDKIAYSRGVI